MGKYSDVAMLARIGRCEWAETAAIAAFSWQLRSSYAAAMSFQFLKTDWSCVVQ